MSRFRAARSTQRANAWGLGKRALAVLARRLCSPPWTDRPGAETVGAARGGSCERGVAREFTLMTAWAMENLGAS